MTRPRFFHIATTPGNRYAMRADTRKALAAHLLTVARDIGADWAYSPLDLIELADKAWRDRSAVASNSVLIGRTWLGVENASKADFEMESEYYVNHVSA